MLSKYFEKELFLKETKLCEIMRRCHSDKSTGHNYTTVYDYLFKDIKNDQLNILEVGLGTNYEDVPSNMSKNGTPLASVRGWREYFPNSQIYGADVDKRILKDENRIKTYYIDQLDSNTIHDFKKKIDVKFDVIIDDGLHTHEANKNLLENLFMLVADGGYYIIEDLIVENMAAFRGFLHKYQGIFDIDFLQIPHGNKHDNRLVILKKKPVSVHELMGHHLTMEELAKQDIDEFTSFFNFEEFLINHNCSKVFSISLFNQNVDSDDSTLKNPQMKEKFLDNFNNLNNMIASQFPEYGIVYWIDSEFEYLDFGNANVYTYKGQIFGAIGMLWRYLPLKLNYVEEVMICDLDHTNIDLFSHYSKQDSSCRILASGGSYYVCNRKDHEVYTFILGSTIKLKKIDIPYDIETLVCQFLSYQKHKVRNELYSNFSNSPRGVGFGNVWYGYGTDERFLSKVIYPYLVNKGLLTTFFTGRDATETQADIQNCIAKGNKVVYL